MKPIRAEIEKSRAAVAALCREHGVRKLEIFGSATREDFDPEGSDLDFLVELDPEGPLRVLDAYFGLKEGLEALFGRRVDLVMPDAVTNPYRRAAIDESREILFEA